MTIKKMYTEIDSILQANLDETVSTCYDEIVQLMTTKVNRNTDKVTLLNSENIIIAIKCYYFKRWMSLIGPKAVEFGPKKHSITGYNIMCRLGNVHWTKQNSAYNKGKAQMMIDLEAETMAVSEIKSKEISLRNTKSLIVETDLGFATKDELLEYFENNDLNTH